MQYPEQVKLTYKLISNVYDLMDLICFPVKSRSPRLGLAKALPNTELAVLDVCCGTGNSLIAIASRNPKNKLTGIDLSKDMLKVAESKIKKLNLHNVQLERMDAAHLQLKDCTFDVVTTSLSLHEMPEDVQRSVLSEMSRMTKKGGKVFIMDWDMPQSTLGSWVFRFFPSLFEPKTFKAFLNLDWETLLKSHGLSLEEVQCYTFSKIIIAVKE